MSKYSQIFYILLGISLSSCTMFQKGPTIRDINLPKELNSFTHIDWNYQSKMDTYSFDKNGNSSIKIIDLENNSIVSIPKNSSDEFTIIPSLSPDGKFLAFNKIKIDQDNRVRSLFIYSLEKGEIISEFPVFGSIAWKNDGKQIAIIESGDFLTFKIFDIQNKQQLRRIESKIKGDISFRVVWAKDGHTLFFCLTDPLNTDFLDKYDLYKLNLETEEITKITDDPKISFTDPSISQDDNLIMLNSQRFEKGHLYSPKLSVLNLSTNCYKEYKDLYFPTSPTWSPDGKQVAFIDMMEIKFLDFSSLSNQNANIQENCLKK
jgi:Tol biopolymer transport system component